MVKRKIVIELCIPNAKCRGEAMALAAKAHGVSSTAISEDRLEVVGENVDAACLVLRLRKKLGGSAKILTMEEVKDKKKEEEEKKKKEAEEKKKKEEEQKKKDEEARKKALEAWQRAGYPYYPPPHPPLPTVGYCYDEPQQAGCHIM